MRKPAAKSPAATQLDFIQLLQPVLTPSGNYELRPIGKPVGELTPTEFGRAIGGALTPISRSTIYGWINSGVIYPEEVTRIGDPNGVRNRLRISVSAIARLRGRKS
ncbi:MAG: hypothetical protein LBC18_03180 [Opitutaceae bacterium]|jgi:hypothetical protein|nr:hypothetical protein [Opitutaceae bacterium]